MWYEVDRDVRGMVVVRRYSDEGAFKLLAGPASIYGAGTEAACIVTALLTGAPSPLAEKVLEGLAYCLRQNRNTDN